MPPYLITIMAILLAEECQVIVGIVRGNSSQNELIHKAGKWIIAGLYGSGSRKDLFYLQFPVVGAIWFFLALIWATAFLYWIINSRMLKGNIRQTLAVAAVFLVGMISAKWVWLPFSVQAGMSGLLFLYIGYRVRQLSPKIHNRAINSFCLCIWGIALWFSYKFDCMSVARSYFPNLVINVLGAVAGSWTILVICRKLEKSNPVSDFLAFVGQNTEVVLCFHLFEMKILPWHIFYDLEIPYVNILVILCKILWACMGIVIIDTIKRLDGKVWKGKRIK